MSTNVIMPQLGESVVEGTVGKWLKHEGDPVKEFDPILEINTDKVDTEIPSPAAGVLLKLLVPVGTLTRQEKEVQVQIRWHTNAVDTFQVALPIRGAAPIPEPVVKRVRELSPTHTDGEIAELLNQEGLLTAQGKPFTDRRVQGLRRRSDIQRPSTQSNDDMCL